MNSAIFTLHLQPFLRIDDDAAGDRLSASSTLFSKSCTLDVVFRASPSEILRKGDAMKLGKYRILICFQQQYVLNRYRAIREAVGGRKWNRKFYAQDGKRLQKEKLFILGHRPLQRIIRFCSHQSDTLKSAVLLLQIGRYSARELRS